MTELLAELTEYVKVLSACAESTSYAEDRSKYSSHLAAAAVMYMHVLMNNREGLNSVVSSERRAYGWNYLGGAEGTSAEKAFSKFFALAETL
jgi:DNA segregation ATPase FtsK/SpoIIIE-like protein